MNEMPSCSSESKRKARKDHVCTNCRVKISKGDTYIYIKGIWNGEARDFKECDNCYKVITDFHFMDKHLEWEDGPTLDPGGVSTWLQNFLYSGWHGEEAAKDIAELFSVPIEYARKQLGLANKEYQL